MPGAAVVSAVAGAVAATADAASLRPAGACVSPCGGTHRALAVLCRGRTCGRSLLRQTLSLPLDGSAVQGKPPLHHPRHDRGAQGQDRCIQHIARIMQHDGARMALGATQRPRRAWRRWAECSCQKRRSGEGLPNPAPAFGGCVARATLRRWSLVQQPCMAQTGIDQFLGLVGQARQRQAHFFAAQIKP